METIDLGHGHTLRFIGWSPDRSIPENAKRFAGVPDDPKSTAMLTHPSGKDGLPCECGIPLNPAIHKGAWKVESWDPLTLSPSILCMACGDHGFIRGGKWVPA